MSLDIKIDDSFRNMKRFITKIEVDVVRKSTRQALNKSIGSVRSLTNSEIRKRIKLKKGELNKRNLTVIKATGNVINSMVSTVKVSGRPVSLIRLVRGTRKPRPQKGVKVNKRKGIRVEIRAGKTLRRPHSFIVKGSGNKNILVRRKTTKKSPIVKQSLPAVTVIVRQSRVSAAIRRHGQQRLEIEYVRAFNNNLSKLPRPR